MRLRKKTQGNGRQQRNLYGHANELEMFDEYPRPYHEPNEMNDNTAPDNHHGSDYYDVGLQNQQEQTHNTRKPRPPVMFRLLFLLFIIIVAFIVFQGNALRLKTVYIVGTHTKTPQYVAELSGLARGLRYRSVSDAEITRNLRKDHTIEFLYTQWVFPDTIYLYVKERTPASSFTWLGIRYTMDDQGMVMTESIQLTSSEGLPTVSGFMQPGSIQVGQMLEVRNSSQMDAYRVIMEELQLQAYISQVSDIKLSDPNDLSIVSIDGITVRLGDASYMRAKIGAARTDIAYLRQLGKTNGILDVSIPEDAKYTPDR